MFYAPALPCIYDHHIYTTGSRLGINRHGCQSSSCGQINGETVFPPVRVCACELDVVTQVRPSRPSSALPFSTPRLSLALTSGFLSFLSLHLLSATTVSFGTANRHRISPATKSGHVIMYIRRLLPRVRRHRDCYSSNQGSSSDGCCLFRKSDEPNFVCPSFPTTAITLPVCPEI